MDGGAPFEGDGDSVLSSKNEREKGVNVQVLLRCRPLNDDELRANTRVVISCNEHLREVSAALSAANKQIDRTFTFDKVFGPSALQKDLYEQAIAPLVVEVLEGYNCTIFAYGQTGTGKTFTMEGSGRTPKNGDLAIDAGIIPRAVQQIFEILETQNIDYSMKVTFFELYNEDITDLLAPDEPKLPEERCKKPIVLMEDGKGGVLLRGLEEEIVYSASKMHKVLEKGLSRRRTAENLENKRSSRSHCMFSMTIHVKECTHDGEEIIKSGKLDLVDLAGSENIFRWGARDGRARETGEINKSLLTLGRVISSLVDHSCHVPYRESKLTRLLRDSLGGKTKTCIIATISPTIHCLDETLCTLDYAHRAKGVRNKPEVNQKMTKSALIKDLYAEINRLKQEVNTAREKNGFYIPKERLSSDEAEKRDLLEKLERLELSVEHKDTQLDGLRELYDTQKLESAKLAEQLKKTQKELDDTRNVFQELDQQCRQVMALMPEKELFISDMKSENMHLNCFHKPQFVENMEVDVSGLFAKIEPKDRIAHKNKTIVQDLHCQLIQQLDLLHRTLSASAAQQESQIRGMVEEMQSLASSRAKVADELQTSVVELKDLHCTGIGQMNDAACELDPSAQSALIGTDSNICLHSSAFEENLTEVMAEAKGLFDRLGKTFSEQEYKLVAFAKLQEQGHLKALDLAQSASKLAARFFEKLDAWAANLSKMVEEAQAAHDRELNEFKKKIEEDADKELELMEMVKKMFGMSSARKKRLVQEGVDGLRDTVAEQANIVHKERMSICEIAASAKDQSTAFMNESESRYHEVVAGTEQGISLLEDNVLHSVRFTKLASRQWRDAGGALQTLHKENSEAMDSLLRSHEECNRELRARLSSNASVTLMDLDAASKELLAMPSWLVHLGDGHSSFLQVR